MATQLATGASSTTTTTVAEAPSSSATEPAAPLVLKLRGKRTRRLRWADDVVDNEDLDRKKSKCCCIFHRQRSFDSDGSGDDGSNHGSDCEEGAAKRQRSAGGDADADAEG